MQMSQTSSITQMKIEKWRKYYNRAIAWWNGEIIRILAQRSWEMKRRECTSYNARNLNFYHFSIPIKRALIKWWTMILISWMTNQVSILVKQAAWSRNNKLVGVTRSPSRYFRTMMEAWLQDSTWLILTISKWDTRWLPIQTSWFWVEKHTNKNASETLCRPKWPRRVVFTIITSIIGSLIHFRKSRMTLHRPKLRLRVVLTRFSPYLKLPITCI